jgi:maltooligosyltrehalose synthase
MRPIEIKNKFYEFYEKTGRNCKGFDSKKLKEIKEVKEITKKTFYTDLFLYKKEIKEQIFSIIKDEGHFAQFDMNMNVNLMEGEVEKVEDIAFKITMTETLKEMENNREIQRITLRALLHKFPNYRSYYEGYSTVCLIIVLPDWINRFEEKERMKKILEERKLKIKNLLSENV